MGETSAGRRLGPYELQSIIGRGGMGIVYRAFQPGVERTVAVKVIGADLARAPTFMRRFEEEARASARLQHPHIVPVYDVGVENGMPYIVTPYLPGGTLAQRIAAQLGGLPLDEVVRISMQVASALDYAHGQGIIHRDLKPGNILLDGQGNAYLVDFGIARLVGSSEELLARPPGTPPYIAPEVVHGQDAQPASDIYSLGIVVFEMLTGRHPSGRPESWVYWKDQQIDPLDLRVWRPDLPRGITFALRQALNPDPGARPPQAAALALALARASGILPDLPASSRKTLPAFTPLRDIKPASDAPIDLPGNGPDTPPPEPAAGQNGRLSHADSDSRGPRTPGGTSQRARRPWLVLRWVVALSLLIPLIVLFVVLVLSLSRTPGF